jgi:hypothetical protein
MASVPLVPICLQMKCKQSNLYNIVNGNNLINAEFELFSVQYYDNNNNPGAFYYSAYNVQVGDWVGGLGGFAWKIIGNIQVLSETSFTANIEDDNSYNITIDGATTGGLPISDSVTGYLLFRLNSDGLPCLTPLSGNEQSSNFLNMPADILSRFNYTNSSRQYIEIYKPGHTFNIGDPVRLSSDSSGNPVYQKATGANVKLTIGIVSRVAYPNVDHFTFKCFGTYYNNVGALFFFY